MHQENAFSTYWNREHELCQALLEIGKHPQKFELIRAYFPVARTAVSFDFPLSESGAPHWWAFSFYAGWQFAVSCPTAAQAVLLTVNEGDLRYLLRVIDKVSGNRVPTPDTFACAFKVIWSLKPRRLSRKAIQKLLLMALLNAFSAGLAAVLWREAASDVQFLNAVTVDFADPAIPLHVRAIQASAATDFGRPFPTEWSIRC